MSRKPRRPRQRTKAARGCRNKGASQPPATDILILSDGTVLAHNLTPGMANVLHKLNPKDKKLRARAARNPEQPS